MVAYIIVYFVLAWQLLGYSNVNKEDDVIYSWLCFVHHRCNICFGAELTASTAANYAVSRRPRQCLLISMVGSTKLRHSGRYD